MQCVDSLQKGSSSVCYKYRVTAAAPVNTIDRYLSQGREPFYWRAKVFGGWVILLWVVKVG